MRPNLLGSGVPDALDDTVVTEVMPLMYVDFMTASSLKLSSTSKSMGIGYDRLAMTRNGEKDTYPARDVIYLDFGQSSFWMYKDRLG